jgi:hypothetical protein
MANTRDSITAYLDSLSSAPGSLLLRNDLNWQGLAPGNEDDVLTVGEDGMPYWQGNPFYKPAWMDFAVSGSYYARTGATYTNAITTFIAGFRRATTSAVRTIYNSGIAGAWQQLFRLGTDGKMYLWCWTPTATIFQHLRSIERYDDDENHYLWHQVDPATGAFEFRIDGLDVDDTGYSGRIANTGTFAATGSSNHRVGADLNTTNFWQGHLSYIGWQQGTWLNMDDFLTTEAKPKPIDTTGWTQWNGAPRIWHESSYLQANRGSYAGFNQAGTIRLSNANIWN